MKIIVPPFVLLASLLPAVCGLCYGMILIFNRESRIKRMLGILMLLLGLCWGISLFVGNLSHANGRAPICSNLHVLFNLLVWPVIRWYMMSMFCPHVGFFPRYFRLLYPFLVSLGLVWVVRAVWGAAPEIFSMREMMAHWGNHPELIWRVVMLVVFLVQTIYFYICSMNEFKLYRRQVRDNFSEPAEIDLQWVRWFVFLWFVPGALMSLMLVFSGDVTVRMWMAVLVSFFMTILAVLGNMQKEIYYLQELLPRPNLEKPKNERMALFIFPSMQNPTTDKDNFKTIFGGLKKLLDEDEIYLLKDLRLDDLALRLNSNKAYVSTVINELYQMNFSMLINRYRINKAIELLNKNGVQIKTAWMQSGFHSQTAFNKAFRREMGMTPSEWMAKFAKNRSVFYESTTDFYQSTTFLTNLK